MRCITGPAGSAGTGDTTKTDYTKETIPDAVNLSEADERLLRLAYAALKAQSNTCSNLLTLDNKNYLSITETLSGIKPHKSCNY